jgi:hypothetical protein
MQLLEARRRVAQCLEQARLADAGLAYDVYEPPRARAARS